MDRKEIEEYKKKRELGEQLNNISRILIGTFLLPWGLAGGLTLFFELGYMIYSIKENPSFKTFLLIIFRDGGLFNLIFSIISITSGYFGIKLIRNVWLKIR